MEASSGSIRFSIPLHFDALLPSPTDRAIVVALAMFVLDVRTPNGLLDGFPYVVAVLMCGSIPSPRAALLMALALMPALLFGYWLSPTGAPTWMAVTNRLVAALASGVMRCQHATTSARPASVQTHCNHWQPRSTQALF